MENHVDYCESCGCKMHVEFTSYRKRINALTRYRVCPECLQRLTTVEIPKEEYLRLLRIEVTSR